MTTLITVAKETMWRVVRCKIFSCIFQSIPVQYSMDVLVVKLDVRPVSN